MTRVRSSQFQSGKLIKNLIGVINIGDKESKNVLAREKALTLCKNIANHQRTKQPMFEFPGMVRYKISVSICLFALFNTNSSLRSTPLRSSARSRP